MDAMFHDAKLFNGDVNNWDTSSVDNMQSMFKFASSFNGDISNWDTSAMLQTWEACLWAWEVCPNLNKWNTARVTTMNAMFHGAESFNSKLSNWDTSSVTDMASMFRGVVGWAERKGHYLVLAHLMAIGTTGTHQWGYWQVEHVKLKTAPFPLMVT